MAILTVIDGALKGESMTLKEGTTRIGRREGNDWVLADGSVSGTHCEIEMNQAGVLLRDLGSTNGTKVNNEPIKEKFLYRNDIFFLGEVPVTITGEDVAVASEQQDMMTPIPRTTIVIKPNRKMEPPPKDFQKKSSSNKHWIAIIILLILVIAGFMVKLIMGS